MRIQLELPRSTVDRLQMLMKEAGIKTYSEIFGYSLTGLDWMVRERRYGRIIVSTDRNFSQVKELSMPILEAIQPEVGPPLVSPQPQPVAQGVTVQD
jgi:hypothetical protein